MEQASQDPHRPLRGLPAVQALLSEPLLSQAEEEVGHEAAVAAAREVIEELRVRIRAGETPPLLEGALPRLAALAAQRARFRFGHGLRRAINATGVILHTGLGRAVLPPQAMADLARELAGYALVELDPLTGKRGRRERHAEELLKVILGCDAAAVVNNNAAAILLALTALAQGKEVIVSRGHLVEIGGSFRMPQIMAQSGARLIEVGTTNRTYLRDFEAALGPQTGALLLVHPSNFKQSGFVRHVEPGELVELGRRYRLPVIYDIGSGNLLPGLAPELKDEPPVRLAVEAGVDLVTFSCDKVLGGPQAGAIVGRADPVGKVREHPLMRALRLDKLILRALESTLALFLDAQRRGQTIPTLCMLRKTVGEIRLAAEGLAKGIKAAAPYLEVDTAVGSSRMGSGSLPEGRIPTVLIRLRDPQRNAQNLAQALRAGPVPVLTRIQGERVCLDPRTLLEGEDQEIIRVLRERERE